MPLLAITHASPDEERRFVSLCKEHGDVHLTTTVALHLLLCDPVLRDLCVQSDGGPCPAAMSLSARVSSFLGAWVLSSQASAQRLSLLNQSFAEPRLSVRFRINSRFQPR